uniref:BZIP domain-containing protein n=2 Tax=Denticeps clupeoides TaxID=299321 RepID=A0AAY4D1K1_9TELE
MELSLNLMQKEFEGDSSEEQGLRGMRRKREFIPDEKKDATYWEKRRRNNVAAKRSREKRRLNDYVLETRLVALSEENARLHDELMALKLRFGLMNPTTYPSQQRSALQLRPCGPQLPPASRPLHAADRELYRGWRQVQRVAPDLLAYGQSSPLPATFIPTHSRSLGGYPYLPTLLPSTNMPFLLPPLLPPTSVPWSGLPLVQSVSQRAASDEEGEQRVPADLGAETSTSMPYKLRMKLQKADTHRDGTNTGSPPH